MLRIPTGCCYASDHAEKLPRLDFDGCMLYKEQAERIKKPTRPLEARTEWPAPSLPHWGTVHHHGILERAVMRNGKTKLGKKGKWVLVSLSVLLFLAASYAVYMEEWSNFHAITPRIAYRSAEVDRDELEYYVAKYKIKSILNLQGIRASDQHYRDEIAVCRERGLAHYDLRLSAEKKPSRHTIDQLICILKVAPRPILIHCRAGSDRAGLAAAIWKVVVDGKSKRLAAEQLSIRYGHLPFGATTAMDHFFGEWQPEQ